jgi:cobyrinic acid a,c-diamide synthase
LVGELSVADPVGTVYRVGSRAGEHRSAEGYLIHRTLGSYIHLHLGSRPEAARALAETCRLYRQTRTKG